MGCVNVKIPTADKGLLTQLQRSDRQYKIEGDIRPIIDRFEIDYNDERFKKINDSSTLQLSRIQDDEIELTLTGVRETATKSFKGKLKNNFFKYGTKRIRGLPLVFWAFVTNSYMMTKHTDGSLVIYYKHVTIAVLTIMPVFGVESDLDIKLN